MDVYFDVCKYKIKRDFCVCNVICYEYWEREEIIHFGQVLVNLTILENYGPQVATGSFCPTEFTNYSSPPRFSVILFALCLVCMCAVQCSQNHISSAFETKVGPAIFKTVSPSLVARQVCLNKFYHIFVFFQSSFLFSRRL